MLHIQQTTPGRWLAATVPGRLVVVESENPTAEFIDEVWAALTDGTDGQRVLVSLTSAGIPATPAFALITWDASATQGFGAVRAIVRGSARITVETDTGQRLLSADGVSTWLEQLIDDVTGFHLDLEDAASASGDLLLPLETGVAWVSSVRTDVMAPAPQVPRAEESAVASSAVASSAVASEETIAEETIASPSALSSAAASASATESSGYIDATQIRPAAEPTTADLGDHDGMTVMSSDIHAMRAEQASAAQPAAEHFVLKIDGGATEPLSDLVLVGRAPSVSKVSGGRVPRLITVGSADQDISRNHVQLAVEGGTVVVTDLHSRNGTLIVLPGRPPQKLRQGEPTSVIVGTVVDLGGGVRMTVGVQ